LKILLICLFFLGYILFLPLLLLGNFLAQGLLIWLWCDMMIHFVTLWCCLILVDHEGRTVLIENDFRWSCNFCLYHTRGQEFLWRLSCSAQTFGFVVMSLLVAILISFLPYWILFCRLMDLALSAFYELIFCQFRLCARLSEKLENYLFGFLLSN